MIFLQNLPSVIITLSLLICTGSMEKKDTSVSLWGKVADFTPECNHWRLRARVSVPALQELTVCFSLKLKVRASSPWTAFVYLHPVGQYAELGLGGRGGQLVVWLFGTEWSTREVNLNSSQWYQLCLTWTQSKIQPTLYINGEVEDVAAAHSADGPPSTSSSCCKLAPNGTLTLGAAHKLVNGNVEVLPFTGLSGRISLFRLWGREWSKEEVTSLKCIEGDLVTWRSDDWDAQACAPVHDSSLRCEWSFYEVKLMFAIFWSDGSHTELHTAIKIAQQWLRDVLPHSIYLHKVSVFEVSGSRTGERFVKANTTVWWVPTYDRFNCLIYATVVPGLDVAAVQSQMHHHLNGQYHPAGLLLLVADDSVRTTAVESFPATTISPTSVFTKPSSPTSPTTMAPDGPATTTASSAAAVSATFTTRATNVSDLYFEVKVNVSITGDSNTEETLSTWVNSSLPDGIMMLDLRLLPKPPGRYRNPESDLLTSDIVSAHAVSRASCVFQIRVTTSLSDWQEMEEQIRDLLLMPYNNGSISIATEDVQIIRIFVVNCRAETSVTKKGVFRWPVTSGGRNATQPCPKNPHAYAMRHCKLSPTTHWLMPDLDRCSLLVGSIPDLDHVQVTAENAPDVVEMIEDLLRNQSALNYDELATVLNKLEDVVNLSVVTPNMSQAVIDIVSEIMRSDSDLLPFTNTILNITEAVGNTMVGYQSSYSLVAPAIAVSVVDVGPGQFNSLTFSVSSDPTGMKPQVFINGHPRNGTVAFISLPSVLRHSFPQNSRNPALPRVTFQFFGLPMLFKSSQKEQILNTFVVSASVTNASSPIQDLAEDVKILLHHFTPNTLHRDVQCVYWNFNENNGNGGWDGRGCRKYNTTPDYTTCLCDHLTHFGVLLDVTRTQLDEVNEQILTIITYVGCGVSSLFLGITVLTYTAFEKLRRDYPAQILINLSLALLGLNLVFLVNSWLSSWGLRGLCVAVASALHYFLLASFTWMGLEAVHMYFALVKVFNVYVPSYILKFCVLGWGIPLVICSLLLIMNSEAYGSQLYSGTQPGLQTLDNSDNFCWIQDHVTFYVSVVAYAVLIFLFNMVVFVVVLIQIRHMRANSPAGTRSGLMQELKGVASLTLLLGLTWTFGFFTWGPARVFLLYLFSGLNSLEGLFIFLFHCLMKENVRKQWRIHLCFGRFRLDEYSERSNSASVGATAKPKSNLQSVPSVRSAKSSSTDSTSASSGSSHRDTSCRRVNLGLLVNSLALPRAQRSSSGAAALPSHRGIHQPPGWRNHLLGQQEQKRTHTHTYTHQANEHDEL